MQLEQSSQCAHISQGGSDVSVLSLLHAVVNAFVSFDVCVRWRQLENKREERCCRSEKKNALLYPMCNDTSLSTAKDQMQQCSLCA